MMPPEKCFGDWDTAVKAVSREVDRIMPQEKLDAIFARTRKAIALKPAICKVQGTGWGALENLLRSVHDIRRRGQRIVLVFGYGGDRDPSKRKVMARIASRMADSLVITSDNSRTENPADIISDILLGVDKESEFAVVPDRAEAIRYAVKHARAGDIILLAGKGHENYEIDRRGKHPFCERDIAVKAAQEFHTDKQG